MKPPVVGTPDGAPLRMLALGILLLAGGRAEGLRYFGGSSRSVLQALTPLAAFFLVALALVVLADLGRGAAADLLGIAVGFLGQLVLSFEVARRWGRAAEWFRFATAFCWCQWAGPMVMATLMVVVAILIAVGVTLDATAAIATVLLFGYGLWLHWFLARAALGLSALRALALVVVVNVTTTALVVLPQFAAPPPVHPQAQSDSGAGPANGSRS